MKGKVKAKTVDRYLRPIRTQICELVEPDSTVLEIGCGNGDLLFHLSPKINSGVGLDISETLIQYALDRKKLNNCSNLDFRISDVIKGGFGTKKFDYVIVSLVFHVLKHEEALALLQDLKGIAGQLIVCAFSEPKTKWQQFLLWLDQRFSGHYKSFSVYQKEGYMNGLFDQLGHTQLRVYNTFDPVIKVYQTVQ